MTATDAVGRIARRSARELAAHLSRYAIVGMVVFAWYLGLTLLLSGPGGLPIQVALAIAYGSSIALHFTLQHLFVWRSRREQGYALSRGQQLKRYFVLAGLQYVFSAGCTAILPGALGLSEQLVYAVSAVAISGFCFVTLRSKVFHVS